jgi:hypothetical protein
MPPFNVGDCITGTPESNRKYLVTNTDMRCGIVTAVTEDSILVEVLAHVNSGHIGVFYEVDPEFFQLLDQDQSELTSADDRDIMSLLAL